MLEMKIKIEVPDLAAAISKLADAIAVDPTILTPDMPRPSATPAAPVVPQAAPVSPVPTTMPGPAPAAPAAPVAPTPVPVVNPTPAPAAVPTPAPVTPQAPTPAPETAASHSNPAPAVPTATPPAYTLDQIARAGAALVDMGKMDALLALLGKYGIAAVTQLQPTQYGTFATELRALGAQI